MLLVDRLSKLRDTSLDDFWQEVEDFLAPATGRLRRTFLAAIERAKNGFDADEIASLIADGDYDGAVSAALGSDASDVSAFIGLRAAVQEAATQTANAIALQEFAHVEVPDITVQFDSLDDATVEALQTATMEMVTDITDSTERGLRTSLMAALEDGKHPDEAARAMRDALGLTDRDAQALANYRDALERGSLEALQRGLRDRRFDRSVRAGSLTRERIDRMVSAYERRLIAHRAESVARTESARAFNLGQDAVWRQAASQLGAESNMRRFWLVAPGERTCEICRAIAGANASGVGLDAPFLTAQGSIMLPPVHPRCRCIVTMSVDLASYARSARA